MEKKEIKLTEQQQCLANLEAELQTNLLVRNQQVECLDLSRQLFGTDDITSVQVLDSIKKTQHRITELENNINILKNVSNQPKNIKNLNNLW